MSVCGFSNPFYLIDFPCKGMSAWILLVSCALVFMGVLMYQHEEWSNFHSLKNRTNGSLSKIYPKCTLQFGVHCLAGCYTTQIEICCKHLRLIWGYINYNDLYIMCDNQSYEVWTELSELSFASSTGSSGTDSAFSSGASGCSCWNKSEHGL